MRALGNEVLSGALKKSAPWAGLATVAATGISKSRLAKILKERKKPFEERMRLNRQEILRNIGLFGAHFSARGFICPLAGQFGSADQRGIPTILPLIQALLMGELATGILMGVHDSDRMEGSVVLDVAQGGEFFEGRRERVFCKRGEILLRDNGGVLASYFQGPDNRTAVHSLSENTVFFIFNTPGLKETALHNAAQTVAELIQPATEKIEWKIFY